MNALEEQADNAKARELFWMPMSWLGTIRPTSANDAFDPALWATFRFHDAFVSIGVGVPMLSSLPRLPNSPLAKCGCKRHALDLYSDHTSTCTAHSHGRKHGTHSTRRDGKRRPAARRCGDSELPSGFIWTRRLLPLFACGSCTLCEGLSSCERGRVCMECVVWGGDI